MLEGMMPVIRPVGAEVPLPVLPAVLCVIGRYGGEDGNARPENSARRLKIS